MWTLVRDVGSWIGGWVLVFMEVQRTEIRESVLAFCGSLLVVPGAAVGATAIVEALAGRRSGTGGSPSPEAQPVSPQSS